MTNNNHNNNEYMYIIAQTGKWRWVFWHIGIFLPTKYSLVFVQWPIQQCVECGTVVLNVCINAHRLKITVWWIRVIYYSIIINILSCAILFDSNRRFSRTLYIVQTHIHTRLIVKHLCDQNWNRIWMKRCDCLEQY